jgi:hypothetical protein
MLSVRTFMLVCAGLSEARLTYINGIGPMTGNNYKGGIMKAKRFLALLAAAFIVLTVSAPRSARAATTTLIVQRSPASGNFATIQSALDHIVSVRSDPTHASDAFIIKVQADSIAYTESFSVQVSNVQIIGDSTAGTFLGGTATQASVSGVQNVVIRNFTFRNASLGISVANSSAIEIRNCIFNLNTGTGTGIQIQGSPSTLIANNTFVNDATAITTDSSVTITNNIFYGNTTAINASSVAPILSYDDFFLNTSNGVTNLGTGSIPNVSTGQSAADPLFVNLGARDFHLQSNSPAKKSGNPIYQNSFNEFSDMGAYGGPFSDIIPPSPVTITTPPTFTPPSTIGLTWSTSDSTSVTAYRVYYGTVSRASTGTYNGAGSPLQVATTSATLTDLPFTQPAAPAAPTNLAITPLDKALQLNWDAAAGATGYRILYSTTGDGTNQPTNPQTLDVGAVTTATIPNLVNGTPYFVAVESLAQAQYFIAVTAVVNSALPSAPGGVNESPFSPEIIQGVGTLVEGATAIAKPDSPEAIVAFPNLKNEGCFIATAAYGFYSAPQVQVLRDFRDRYLLTNAPGRAFVAWYYHYGPIGAHFINVHPWLKPPVRLVLLPLVIGSFLLIHTPPLVKIAIILLAIVVSVLLFLRNQKKMLIHSGGMR